MVWRSNYRNQVENEWKNRIKGNHKTFGLPSQRDADTVVSSNKKCTGRQSSSKRECLKEKCFPPVPKSGEKPLEIEKIDHNFVAENSQCVEKKGKEFSCKALFPPVEYVHKRDYGTLPMYLVRRKQEEEGKAKLKCLHELERVNTEKEEQQKTINTYEKDLQKSWTDLRKRLEKVKMSEVAKREKIEDELQFIEEELRNLGHYTKKCQATGKI